MVLAQMVALTEVEPLRFCVTPENQICRTLCWIRYRHGNAATRQNKDGGCSGGRLRCYIFEAQTVA